MYQRNNQFWLQCFPMCNIMQMTQMHFKYCQVENNVQTACEAHDLNVDFHSVDNGFKQLYAYMYLQ